MKNKEVFSTHETARICHVHHTTIINWINDGKLSSYATPGGHRRVRREDLIDFMERYGIPRPSELQSRRRRVLLVDDDKKALAEFRDALGGEEYALEVASDGFEAGKKIYGYKVDLILLDFRMPGMDGFQVCRSLKKDENTKDIPVVAVTVLRSDYDLSRMKKYGVDWYMEKPVDPEDLKQLVKMVLGTVPQDKELRRKYALEKK